ncbi:MAG TPA: RHS repeat-associated core domain-containing protein, partial [Acidimicrobiales bacterium]|nr:RHS repeat-associated core domain-containing protein [Acidimicrobiales bacterium]
GPIYLVAGGSVTRLRYGSPGDSGATYETDTAGSVVVSHLAGPGGLLADYTPGATTYMFADPHGSVVGQTDAAGTVTNRFTYDEYGNGAAPADGYGWLGTNRKKTDPGAGVLVMGARGYDPGTGRFLQRDPVEGGSANDYDYVSGDPVNQFDLQGTICWRCAGRHLKSAAKKVGRGLASCARDPDGCVTNAKIAISPLIAAGATVAVGAGLVAACATILGCVVALPVLGGGVVAGSYATYRLAKKVWFGKDRHKAYRRHE